ncbi:hypothetical protein NC652_034558 [Populus alba x Populus x berolinensis]|nr:hypothetical protein NC652_034558 [Populus alba x Populus x berolinensis]
MLGILPFFRKINLSINNFHDTVPQEIGRLFCLQSLSLNYNSFGGELFRNLSHCSNFGMLNIEKNSFIEYGLVGEVLMLGDVYSFETLLLEIFTGKGPTYNMFSSSINLMKFS